MTSSPHQITDTIIYVRVTDSDGNQIAPTQPLAVQLSVGDVAASSTNPVPTQPSIGNVAVSASNPLPITGAVQELATSTDWKYTAASGGITDTSDVILHASAGAGLYNALVSMQIINTDATVGTEVVVKDGSTVIWRGFAPASIAAVTQPSMISITFNPPLVGSAATAMNAACITTSSQTYINAQGIVVG
jgi:hypothetical protein